MFLSVFSMFLELKNKTYWIAVARYLFGSASGSTNQILKGIGKFLKNREELDQVELK